MRVVPAGVLAFLLAGGGCRKETLDKPDAPDMTEVLGTFEAPTGTFDAASVGAVRSQIDEAVRGLVGSGLPEQLARDVEDALSDLENAKGTRQQSIALEGASGEERGADAGIGPRAASLDGEGFGRVTRVCPGWGPEPSPDVTANGRLSLTITFTDLSIDPVVWGVADRCHLALGKSRVLLDRGDPNAPADLRVHLGGNLSVGALGTLPIVVALSARAQVDDLEVRGDFAVRLLPRSTTIELAVRLGDGDVVVVLSGSSSVVGVRAKNGTFTCDTTGCLSAAGEVVAW